MQNSHSRPFSTNATHIHNFNYRAVVTSKRRRADAAEAFLTVNTRTGTVHGRVTATDGRVFLLTSPPREASWQLWMEIDLEAFKGEGDDVKV